MDSLRNAQKQDFDGWDTELERDEWNDKEARIEAEAHELQLFVDWVHDRWSVFFEKSDLKILEVKKGDEEAYFQASGDACCWIKDGVLITNDGGFAFTLLWMEYKKMI